MFTFCSVRVKAENQLYPPFARIVTGPRLVDDGDKDSDGAGRSASAPLTENPQTLSDDVGRDLVFDEGDAVAQLQLPLLQTLHHQ